MAQVRRRSDLPDVPLATQPGAAADAAAVPATSRGTHAASTTRQRRRRRRTARRRVASDGGPARGPPGDERTADVADLLYVGLVIAMFAVLVLAARGLERL